jgi:hypothetical protein
LASEVRSFAPRDDSSSARRCSVMLELAVFPCSNSVISNTFLWVVYGRCTPEPPKSLESSSGGTLCGRFGASSGSEGEETMLMPSSRKTALPKIRPFFCLSGCLGCSCCGEKSSSPSLFCGTDVDDSRWSRIDSIWRGCLRLSLASWWSDVEKEFWKMIKGRCKIDTSRYLRRHKIVCKCSHRYGIHEVGECLCFVCFIESGFRMKRLTRLTHISLSSKHRSVIVYQHM